MSHRSQVRAPQGVLSQNVRFSDSPSLTRTYCRTQPRRSARRTYTEHVRTYTEHMGMYMERRRACTQCMGWRAQKQGGEEAARYVWKHIRNAEVVATSSNLQELREGCTERIGTYNIGEMLPFHMKSVWNV